IADPVQYMLGFASIRAISVSLLCSLLSPVKFFLSNRGPALTKPCTHAKSQGQEQHAEENGETANPPNEDQCASGRLSDKHKAQENGHDARQHKHPFVPDDFAQLYRRPDFRDATNDGPDGNEDQQSEGGKAGHQKGNDACEQADGSFQSKLA